MSGPEKATRIDGRGFVPAGTFEMASEQPQDREHFTKQTAGGQLATVLSGGGEGQPSKIADLFLTTAFEKYYPNLFNDNGVDLNKNGKVERGEKIPDLNKNQRMDDEEIWAYLERNQQYLNPELTREAEALIDTCLQRIKAEAGLDPMEWDNIQWPVSSLVSSGKKAVPLLMKMLKDGSEKEKVAALIIIGDMLESIFYKELLEYVAYDPKELVEEIVDVIKRGELQSVKFASAVVLVNMYTKTRLRLNKDHIAILVQALGSNENKELKGKLILLLSLNHEYLTASHIDALLDEFEKGDEDICSQISNMGVNLLSISDEQLQRLLTLAVGEDPVLNKWAMHALHLIDAKRIVAAVLQIVKTHKDPKVRENAMDVLRSQAMVHEESEAMKRILPEIVLFLEDPDLRNIAMDILRYMLEYMKDKKYLPLIISLLDDPYLRADAAQILGEKTMLDNSAIKPLLKALREDDGWGYTWFGYALAEYGDQVYGELVNIVTDNNASTFARQGAIIALEKMEGKNVRPLFEKLAKDGTRPLVEIARIRSVLKLNTDIPDDSTLVDRADELGSAKDLQALIELYEGRGGGGTPLYVTERITDNIAKIGAPALKEMKALFAKGAIAEKEFALEAIVKIQGQEALPLLKETLNSNDWRMRDLALERLDKVEGERATMIITAALQDKNQGVRVKALLILKKRGDKAALPALKELLKNKDINPYFKRGVEEAIQYISGKEEKEMAALVEGLSDNGGQEAAVNKLFEYFVSHRSEELRQFGVDRMINLLAEDSSPLQAAVAVAFGKIFDSGEISDLTKEYAILLLAQCLKKGPATTKRGIAWNMIAIAKSNCSKELKVMMAPGLIDALEDPDDKVKNWVAWAVAELAISGVPGKHLEKAVDAFVSAFEPPEEVTYNMLYYRGNFMYALGCLALIDVAKEKKESYVHIALKYLRHSDGDFRINTVFAAKNLTASNISDAKKGEMADPLVEAYKAEKNDKTRNFLKEALENLLNSNILENAKIKIRNVLK